MGLDAVEIVLRTEELFVITIGDDEAGEVRTVGDFYKPNLREVERDTAAITCNLNTASPRLRKRKRSSCFFKVTRPCQPRRNSCLGHPKACGTASLLFLSISKVSHRKRFSIKLASCKTSESTEADSSMQIT